MDEVKKAAESMREAAEQVCREFADNENLAFIATRQDGTPVLRFSATDVLQEARHLARGLADKIKALPLPEPAVSDDTIERIINAVQRAPHPAAQREAVRDALNKGTPE